MQNVQEREEQEHYTSLADQHSAWHRHNGWSQGCPLDCAAADVEPEPEMDLADEIAWDLAQRGVRCGSCRDRHPSVAWVRACYNRGPF